MAILEHELETLHEFEFEGEGEGEGEFEGELGELEAELEGEGESGEGFLGNLLGGLLGEGEGELEGELEGEGEFELEGELELEGEFELEGELGEISPVRKIYADAMMEHMAHMAANAETEQEAAEHFLPLIGMEASKLLPVVGRALAGR